MYERTVCVIYEAKTTLQKNPSLSGESLGGSGGGRELFFDQKQIHLPAGNIGRWGQSENVMLSHAILTTTAMALRQASTTPPSCSGATVL